MSQLTPERVIKFWFEDSAPEDWFGGKSQFDDKVRAQFFEYMPAAEQGEFWQWRESAEGCLAEIIMLDQFTRQLYRGEARAFASDPLALSIAQSAVARGLDLQIEKDRRNFLYMPYMHSESLVIHNEAEKLFGSLENPMLLEFEIKHKKLIERFGRYPMRNAALGRTDTPEEKQYVEDNTGSMF